MVTDNRLIDGKAVQTRILDQVRVGVAEHAKTRPVGKLVSISIGDNPEVAVYIRGQARAAAKVNIPFEEIFWPGDIDYATCKQRLAAMNDDNDILGIILQRPVPEHINMRSLQSSVHLHRALPQPL